LTAEDATGSVVIDDGLVTLTGMKGKMAGGELRANAVLDFKSEPARLHFDPLEIQGLDVHKLPASWKVPKEFGGKLVGKAVVTVLIRKDGPVTTTGQGDAYLADARVLDAPAEVRLRLASGKGGLRFEQNTASPAPPAENEAPLPPGRRGGLRPQPGAPPHGPPPRPLPPPAAGRPAGEPTYVTATLRVRDVDLAELVKRLEVKLPIGLAGRLSVEVNLAIPVNTPRDLKAYRLTGTASSPKLTLEQLDLEDVK